MPRPTASALQSSIEFADNISLYYWRFFRTMGTLNISILHLAIFSIPTAADNSLLPTLTVAP